MIIVKLSVQITETLSYYWISEVYSRLIDRIENCSLFPFQNDNTYDLKLNIFVGR